MFWFLEVFLNNPIVDSFHELKVFVKFTSKVALNEIAVVTTFTPHNDGKRSLKKRQFNIMEKKEEIFFRKILRIY